MSGKVKSSWFFGDLQQLAAELGGVSIIPLDWCRDLDPGDLGLRLTTEDGEVWVDEAAMVWTTKLEDLLRLLPAAAVKLFC